MDLQLKDKLVVVTGSTGDGIGKTIAQEFARYGAYLIVNGRKQDALDEAVQAIRKETKADQDHVIGIQGDLGSGEGVDEFIEQLTKEEQRLGVPVEILINNVGIFHTQDFVDISDEQWMQYYQVNTMSGVRLARHFLPAMLQRNSSARILFISSECGLRPLPHMLAYSVSKTSQISLSRGLAEMTKGTHVTVNAILPGPTMTAGVLDYMKGFAKLNKIESLDEAVAKYFLEHETTSLLQRFLDPKEIANVCCFLASPLASGINGTAQHVDGGIVRHLS